MCGDVCRASSSDTRRDRYGERGYRTTVLRATDTGRRPPTQWSLYASTHRLPSPTGLSLAAPCRASVGASTCGDTVRQLRRNPAGRKTPAGFANSGYLLVLHLNQRACSPAAALGHRLLVGGEVEGEEEEEVRGDDADTGDGSELLASALAHVGDVGPVGAGEVGEGGEVDEACGLLVLNEGTGSNGKAYQGRGRIG